jgi:F-type H+-transporting ATPase subunit b
MESLIHAFGIDVRLITIQVINFVVLAGLLSYFLYKPLMRIVSEREEKIRQGLDDAEKAKEALAGAETEKKSVLAAAQSTAAEMERRATTRAKAEAADIVSEANASAAEKIKQAEARAEVLKQEAVRQSEAEVAKLAVLAAEEILKKS